MIDDYRRKAVQKQQNTLTTIECKGKPAVVIVLLIGALCMPIFSGCSSNNESAQPNDNASRTQNSGNVNSTGNSMDSSNSNSNANMSNSNDAYDTTSNKKNAAVDESIPSDANHPIFVVRYSNYAWGFHENYTLYDSSGQYYEYENMSGAPLSNDKSNPVTAEVISEVLSQGQTGKADMKKITSLYKEAVIADFNAPQTKPRHKANDYGTIDIYILGSDGEYHWICKSGDDESRIDDPNIIAVSEFFSAKL